MSWKAVNEILSLALIDSNFCQDLLDNPLGAIQRYDFPLTEREQQVLSQVKFNDLTQLSQVIVEQLAEKYT